MDIGKRSSTMCILGPFCFGPPFAAIFGTCLQKLGAIAAESRSETLKSSESSSPCSCPWKRLLARDCRVPKGETIPDPRVDQKLELRCSVPGSREVFISIIGLAISWLFIAVVVPVARPEPRSRINTWADFGTSRLPLTPRVSPSFGRGPYPSTADPSSMILVDDLLV